MTREPELLVEMVTGGPFMENCFIVADADSRKGVIFDPGDVEDRILARVRELDLEITEIVATHGHVDHVGAVAPLQRILGAPFAIHPADKEWLLRLPHQAMVFGLPAKETPTVDRELAPGETIQVGDHTAVVLHTPGHSAGGCSFLFAEHKTVIVGDTLFAGSIGRTDLPGGSFDLLLESIRQQLLVLDDDVVVHCGHGPSTEIGTERRHNPFLQPGASLLF